MHCKGNLKLRSHNTSYCLIEVVTKAGLTVVGNMCTNFFANDRRTGQIQHICQKCREITVIKIVFTWVNLNNDPSVGKIRSSLLSLVNTCCKQTKHENEMEQ